MKPREEELRMQIALVLMQQNREVEVENDKQLPDDRQLAEVPHVGVVVVHVADQHDAVDQEEHAQVALL